MGSLVSVGFMCVEPIRIKVGVGFGCRSWPMRVKCSKISRR